MLGDQLLVEILPETPGIEPNRKDARSTPLPSLCDDLIPNDNKLNGVSSEQQQIGEPLVNLRQVNVQADRHLIEH
jgi:hypothetical protein